MSESASDYIAFLKKAIEESKASAERCSTIARRQREAAYAHKQVMLALVAALSQYQAAHGDTIEDDHGVDMVYDTDS